MPGSLAHGQERTQRTDHDHQRKRRAGGQQPVKLRCREDGQVQHADTAALQHEAIRAAPRADTPAKCEQHDSAERDARQTELDRQHRVIGRVFE